MQTVLLSRSTTDPTPLKLRDLLARHDNPPVLVELEQAEPYLSSSRTSRLIVVLSPLTEVAIHVLQRVRGMVAGPILAVGPTVDPKLILRVLNEGASHYVDEADLEGQLEGVLLRLSSRDTPTPAPSGRLIALLGASGGSGTSTLAVNLAAVLAREARRCALVDLHPGAGDLAALLDLKPTHNLADLCVKASRMDQAMVQSALAGHSCGISLLAPPSRYDDISLVTPHGVQKVLTLIRQLYPFTVLDLEDCFHEEQVIALRQADSVLLVFRPDFTSLRNMRRLLDHFDQLGLPPARLQLVLNRCGQAKELPAEEVEQALGTRVAHQVPDDPKTVNGANNTGIPAVLKAASARVSQVIVEMARSVNPAAEMARAAAPRRSASWLGFR
jgi:pilus assembly protein CpaE